MKEDISTLPFLQDQNYLDLSNHYVEHPIALYTGAGVSWSDKPKYQVGLWDGLVRRILLSDKNIPPGVIKEFDQCNWNDQPWQMADWVAEKIGHDKFNQYMVELIQQGEKFQDAYKLLKRPFLRSARTLNATVAFCADFSGGKVTQRKDGYWYGVYKPSINRRVHAVVTSNYDPFLEAASATMFRNNILKPVAAEGSSVGNLVEIPVFHIHGYVRFPYKFRKQGEPERKPFVDPVLTTRDYLKAWESENAYNPTMGPQIHILRHYSVLFIGFSFRDWKINGLLKNLNKERAKRKDRLYHYAIMRKDEVDAKGREYFENTLGVRPIPIDDFPQIKNLLSHLYQQALVHDHPGEGKIKLAWYEGRTKTEHDKPVFLTPAGYFEELYNCNKCEVRKKSTFVYNEGP